MKFFTRFCFNLKTTPVAVVAGLLLLANAGFAGVKRPVAQDSIVAQCVPSNPTPAPQETITVAINIDMTQAPTPHNRLASYQAKLEWDPAVLHFENFTVPAAPWNNPVVNATEADSGRIAWNAFAPGGDNPGVLNMLNLTFTATGSPGSETDLQLAFSEMISSTFKDLLDRVIIESCRIAIPGAPPVAPVLQPIADQQMSEGATLLVAVSTTEPGRDDIVLAANNLPAFGQLFDNGNATGDIQFAPGFDAAGVYSDIQVIASDKNDPSLADTTYFTLIVNDFKAEFTAEPLAGNAPLPVQFTDLSTGDIESYLWNFGDGNTSTAQHPAHTYGKQGLYTVSLVITFPGPEIEKSDTLTKVDYIRVFGPPQLAPIADQEMVEDSQLTVAISATDPDGDAITLSAANLPAFATFIDSGNGSGSVTFTPAPGDAGTYPNLLVIATDNGTPVSADSVEFTLTVSPANRPPQLAPIADQQTEEGSLLQVQITATDPDSDKVAFSVNNLPAFGSLIDHGDGTGTILFVPTPGSAGVYPGIEVVATDDGTPSLADTVSFTLTVVEKIAPLVTSVEIGTPEDSSFTCEDSVEVCLDIQISGGLPPYSINGDINGVSLGSVCALVPLEPGYNTLIATVTVTDSLGATSTATDTITVFANVLESFLSITSPEDSIFVCDSVITVVAFTGVDGGFAPYSKIYTLNGDTVAAADTTFEGQVELVPGYNTLIASSTTVDSLGCEAVASDTVVVFFDPTPPECTFDLSQLPLITGEAFDYESGIAKIEVIRIENRIVEIDSFTVGDPVVRFRSEIIHENQASGFTLKVTNRAGCVAICDPIYLRLDPTNLACDYTFTLPETDHYFYVDNKGISQIQVDINDETIYLVATENGSGRNGNTFFMPRFGQRSIDLADFLVEGENTYRLTCSGEQDAIADVIIADFRIDASTTGVEPPDEPETTVPLAFGLQQNYPNPFNPETKIAFTVPAGWSDPVTLRVYNIRGQLVQTLADGYLPQGRHATIWDGRDFSGAQVATGIYFYELRSGNHILVKKMLLEK